MGKTIGILFDDAESSLSRYLKEEGNEIWKDQLDTVMDWTLINCQPNTEAGFAGAAFRSPEGETVIAFRGTEPTELSKLYIDVKTDYKIYNGWDDDTIAQFTDAKKFVC